MKGEIKLTSPPPPLTPGKSTLKKPSLIRVNLFTHHSNTRVGDIAF